MPGPVADVISAVDRTLPPTTLAALVVGDGGEDDLLVLARDLAEDDSEAGTAAFYARMNALLLDGPPRTLAGLLTRCRWSPTEHGASADAWTVVVVTAGEDPAWVCVRRVVEDHRPGQAPTWTVLDGPAAPWFTMATASGLRAALVGGQSLVVRTVGDPALLRPVTEPPPRPGPDGRI